MAREALLSGAAGRFVRQLLDLIGPEWVTESVGERRWASVTFEGLRVRAAFVRHAAAAARPPADLRAAIEQADYGVGRYLVADVAAHEQCGCLTVEALLIEQA